MEEKKIVNTMTFGVALAYLFYAFAPSWEWILVGAIVSNLFLIYQPALMAIRADSVPPEKRGTGFALANFLPRLVCIPAPIIAFYLVSKFELVPGMRIAYLAATSLGIGAAATRMFLKETLPKKDDKPPTENFSDLKKELGEDYSTAFRFLFERLPILALFYIVFNFSFQGCLPFFPIFANPQGLGGFLGLSNESWGIIFLAAYIFSTMFLIPVGISVDIIGRRKTLLFVISIAVFATIMYVITPPQTQYTMLSIIISYSLIMFVAAAFRTATSALEADFIPLEKRGRVSGTLAIISSLAAAAGQAVTGLMYEQIDPHFPFFLSAVLMTASFLIVFLFLREPKERKL